MLYIAENLKRFRKEKDLTQEDVAEMLLITPQSVSKWERGESYPDISFMPALANLFDTSVDALIGMDKIRDTETLANVFRTEHDFIEAGNLHEATIVLDGALKTFPNNEGLMSDLGITLSFSDDSANLERAANLLERVLATSTNEKVRATSRAALCFVYLKVNKKEKAVTLAKTLPHTRESREIILPLVSGKMGTEEINSNIKTILIGMQ
jgi:transcriptional regulator with XRE-family HTH domain